MGESGEPIGFWIGFVVFVIIMLLLDLFVFHKKDQVVKLKEALLWSAFWIGLAIIFNIGVYFFLSPQKALEFFTGYLIEESLSVDNLFVFIMIFSAFKIAPQYQHRILFWGIIGAIVMRAIFIFAGVALINKFAWIMYIFGAFLIYTGIHMLLEKEENKKIDTSDNKLLKFVGKFIPVTEDMSSHKFFVKIDGKRFATPFFMALIMIEGSDLIFAVDSIPAVMSVSKDPFIIYTSNIFAILGLRSLYFALSGIMGYFRYLKYGLSIILTFIGFKMCFNEFSKHVMEWDFYISNFVSLGVIVGLLTISIVASIIKTNQEKKEIKDQV